MENKDKRPISIIPFFKKIWAAALKKTLIIIRKKFIIQIFK